MSRPFYIPLKNRPYQEWRDDVILVLHLSFAEAHIAVVAVIPNDLCGHDLRTAVSRLSQTPCDMCHITLFDAFSVSRPHNTYTPNPCVIDFISPLTPFVRICHENKY